jgi:hypothetical protein
MLATLLDLAEVGIVSSVVDELFLSRKNPCQGMTTLLSPRLYVVYEPSASLQMEMGLFKPS